MTRHHDRAFNVWRVEAQIVDERLRKSLYGELGGAVGGMRRPHADRGPEAVDAGGVDDMSLVRPHEQRQEGPHPEIDAAPADVEGSLPLRARIGEQAAAAANPRIVEQQMDP